MGSIAPAEVSCVVGRITSSDVAIRCTTGISMRTSDSEVEISLAVSAEINRADGYTGRRVIEEETRIAGSEATPKSRTEIVIERG